MAHGNEPELGSNPPFMQQLEEERAFFLRRAGEARRFSLRVFVLQLLNHLLHPWSLLIAWPVLGCNALCNQWLLPRLPVMPNFYAWTQMADHLLLWAANAILIAGCEPVATRTVTALT